MNNSNKTLENKISISQLIKSLKEKNIKFNYISEEDAKKYLKLNNNYHNLISYNNLFQKYPSPAGIYEGKYIDLDFAYLKDLAIIDYELRQLLFQMIIDIEHYLKLRIINQAENNTNKNINDIINLFLNNDYNTTKRIHNSILKKINKNNYQDFASKYNITHNKLIQNISLYDFLKTITFGELISFYDFYTIEYNLIYERRKITIFALNEIVKLRNAVCHNQNILNDLHIQNKNLKTSYVISKFLKSINNNSNSKKNKISNFRIQQIINTLYYFKVIVTSNEIIEHTKRKINEFFYLRLPKNSIYYQNNKLLKFIYHFFDKVIRNLYDIS